MARTRIRKLPPRYSFLLNPYIDVRLSRCPNCERPTHARKFALLIHADGWGPLVLGKTCRYCTPCELVIAHRDELDAEMALSMARIAPVDVGRPYIVLGTVDKKVWTRGLHGEVPPLGDVLEHVAEFKEVMQLTVEPGGWVREEKAGPADHSGEAAMPQRLERPKIRGKARRGPGGPAH